MEITGNKTSIQHRLSVTSGILLVVLGLIFGWLAGGLIGFITGVPFALIKGWPPYFVAIRAAVSCIVIGIPAGLIGSCIALFFRSTKLTVAVFIVCATVIAVLLFLAYSDNHTEAAHSFLYGAVVGPLIGLAISVGFVPARRALVRRNTALRQSS